MGNKLVINYKAYAEGIDKGIEIAYAAREAADSYGVDVVVAAPFTLCREISRITHTIAQSIEPIDPGAFTGRVGGYEIRKAGCSGALINHAENRKVDREIEACVEACKKNMLESYVCVDGISEARKAVALGPSAVAYEPKELIGSGISVSGAKPDIIGDFVRITKEREGVVALAGAGISSAKDIEACVRLGCGGVLVSSAVMKGDFRRVIKEFAEALS